MELSTLYFIAHYIYFCYISMNIICDNIIVFMNFFMLTIMIPSAVLAVQVFFCSKVGLLLHCIRVE